MASCHLLCLKHRLDQTGRRGRRRCRRCCDLEPLRPTLPCNSCCLARRIGTVESSMALRCGCLLARVAVSLLALVASASASDKSRCLMQITAAGINERLRLGGAGTRITLCPDAIITVEETITFTAKDQSLTSANKFTHPVARILNRLVYCSIWTT